MALGRAQVEWQDELELGDLRVPYRVTRKRVKGLRLRISRETGALSVSAPAGYSRRAVAAWVRSQAEWVERHRQPILAQVATVEALPPDEFYLWGERRRVSLLPAKGARPRVALQPDGAHLYVPENAEAEAIRRSWKSAVRDELLQRAEPLVHKWADELQVDAPELRLREMRTRWGTCNPRRGRVWLRLNLVAYAPKSLEYVVVHELAHLIVPAHNAAFYAVLDRALPGWQIPHRALKSAQPLPFVPRILLP